MVMVAQHAVKPNSEQSVALTPALVSIPDAAKYMGGIGRSKFYTGVLPLLQTVNFGARRFVVVSSMDALIDERASGQGAALNGTATEHRIAAAGEPPDPCFDRSSGGRRP
jgi:hypothetical protein